MRHAEHSAYGPTRLLQWNPHVGETNVLLFHVSGPREPFLSSLADVATAEFVDSSVASDVGGFYLYVREQLEGSARALVDAYAGENVVVMPPVVYGVDRSIQLTIVGNSNALQRTLDGTPDEIEISVQKIRSEATGVTHLSSQLSERQREVLTAAIDAGYYEEPRQVTVADVSNRLDCAPSTVAEHLRKAESTLVHHAVDNTRENE